MRFILYTILGIVPSLLWLGYFRKKDYISPEPWGRLIVIMVLGAVSVIAAGFIEAVAFGITGISDTDNVLGLLGTHTFFVGFIEEGVKFLVVYLFVFFSPEFNEPVDGLIYATASAIGFSHAENALYASSFGLGNFMLRALLATLGHIMFSSIWGYELGRYRYDRRGQGKVLILSIFVAALAHGIYNTLVSIDYLLIAGMAFVFIFLWRFISVYYKRAIKRSLILYQQKGRERREALASVHREPMK